MDKNINIKEQIKTIVQSSGVESQEIIEAIAQKCYDEVYWRPYGGAISYAEIDQTESAREYSYKVSDEAYKLQAIVSNILSSSSEEMGISEKTSAIQKAADEYGSRVNALDPETEGTEQKSLWEKFKSLFSGNELKAGHKIADSLLISNSSGNKVKIFWDEKAQKFRWLTTSSNAFEDLENELFSTKALEDAVQEANKTGERGPLMFYHIKNTEIGDCDFQTVIGRMLVESGTFRDTPLAQQAIKRIQESDEEWQVSIGYKYEEGDELDGVYDWLGFRERSICPSGTAANPYTNFKIVGEIEMNDNEKAQLISFFGAEMAQKVIDQNLAATVELEKTVRYKTFDVEGFVKEYSERTGQSAEKALEIANKMKSELEAENPKEDETPKEDESEEEKAVDYSPMFQKIIDEFAAIRSDISGIQEQVKSLQQTDDEKVAQAIAPRYSLETGKRPTESGDNVLTDEKAKEAIGDKEGDQTDAQYWSNILTGAGKAN